MNKKKGPPRPSSKTSTKKYARAQSAHHNGLNGAAGSSGNVKDAKQVGPSPVNLPHAMAQYHSNVVKTKAKHILHDPEALREKLFVLEAEYEEIKKKNEKLKKKHDKLEKENEEYEQFIKENEAFWMQNNTHESTLLVSLKKKQKKLEETLTSKEQELRDSLKGVKHTKIQEMEIEVQELEKECQRLNSIFTELMQNGTGDSNLTEVEQRYYKQRNMINFLKRDNEDMTQKLEILSSQNDKYKEEIENYDYELSEADQLLEELSTLLKQREQQLKALKRESTETNINKNEKKIKEELDRAVEKNANLQAALSKKQEEVDEKESDLERLKERLEDQLLRDRKEREKLEKEYERLNNMHSSDDEEENEVSATEEEEIRRHQESERHNEEEEHNDEDHEEEEHEEGVDQNQESPDEEEQDDQIPDSERVYPPQNYDDIDPKASQLLAKEIVYRLMVSQIEQENIDLHLFTPEERRDGTCDIDKFISRLENEPLCLYEDRKRDIILSELTWRTSNEEKIQNITAIKGAFIDFVGNYDVFSEEEQRELRLVIFKKYILGHEGELKEQYALDCPSNSGLITSDELKAILLAIEKPIAESDLDFIIFSLFQQSGLIEELRFDDIFNLFKISEEVDFDDSLNVDDL